MFVYSVSLQVMNKGRRISRCFRVINDFIDYKDKYLGLFELINSPFTNGEIDESSPLGYKIHLWIDIADEIPFKWVDKFWN